jgi:hypothetical protein
VDVPSLIPDCESAWIHKPELRDNTEKQHRQLVNFWVRHSGSGGNFEQSAGRRRDVMPNADQAPVMTPHDGNFTAGEVSVTVQVPELLRHLRRAV